jgi:hypothetical protein
VNKIDLTPHDLLVDEDPLYQALGGSPEERRRAYRALLGERIVAGELDAVPGLSEGLFVGSPAFVEGMVGRFGGRLHVARTRVTPLPEGVVALGFAGRGGHRTSTARGSTGATLVLPPRPHG